jgi:hypothetical protein
VVGGREANDLKETLRGSADWQTERAFSDEDFAGINDVP